jgi:hypothetical protein
MDGVHPLLVNFPLDVWAAVDDAARASGRSRTALIVDACRAADWWQLAPVSPVSWGTVPTRKDAGKDETTVQR